MLHSGTSRQVWEANVARLHEAGAATCVARDRASRKAARRAKARRKYRRRGRP